MQYWTMFEVLSLLCFLPCSSSEAIDFNPIGVMRPRDPYLFVGENITLFCNLKNSEKDADSSQLYFTRMGDRIAEEYMSTVSPRSLRLNYPATIKDNVPFACWMNINKTVDALRVQVVYPPVRVKNVTCKVLNWRNMTCRWKLGPENYTHKKDINVSLIWTISGVQRDCPKLKNTSCFWSGEYPTGHSSADVFLPDNEYNMTVVVTNTKRNVSAESTPFIIDSRKYVKPDPVHSFSTVEKNATCIRLKWNHSEKVRDKIALLEYCDEWTLDCRIVEWKNLSRRFTKEEVDATICDLTPFTNYTIRIGIWPEGPDGKRTGFRSDFVYRTEGTEASAPEVGPETCIGCFTAVPPENHDQRNVLIYWKHIPPKLRYSIIVGYSICNPDSTVDNTHNSCSVTDANTTSWLLVLQKTQQYTLQLYAMTQEKKRSGNFSTITIPSQDALPDAPSSFVVERDRQWDAGGKTFYLRWGRANGTLRYLVVWCKGSLHSLMCDRQIDNDPQWNAVPGNSTQYNLNVNGGDPKQYLVGVTRQVMRDGVVVGSGIVWATCIYIRNEAPNPPKYFLTSLSGESLLVNWKKQGCDEIHISFYVVYYCKFDEHGNCTGERKELNVTDDWGAVINGLEAGANYSVRVSAVSSEWGEGALSDSITSIVSSSQQGTNATIFTVVGVILGVTVLLFLVLIGVYKYRRHYLKNWEKFLKSSPAKRSPESKMQDRDLPSIPGLTAPASGTNSASKGYASDMSHCGASNAQSKRSGNHESITSETSLLSKEGIDDSRRRSQHSGNSSTSERTMLLAKEIVSNCDSDSGADTRCSSVDSGGTSSENSNTSPEHAVRPVIVKSGYVQDANDPTLTTASRGPVPSVPPNAPHQSQAGMPPGNVDRRPFSSDYTPDTQTLSPHGNIVTKPFSYGCIPTAELGALPPLNGPNSIASDFIQKFGSFPPTNIGPKSAGSGYIQETERLHALPALGSMKAQSAYPVTSWSTASCTPSSLLAAKTMNLINPYVDAEIGTVHSSSGSMHKAVNSQANKDAAVFPMGNMCPPNLAPTVKGYALHSMFQMNDTIPNGTRGIHVTSLSAASCTPSSSLAAETTNLINPYVHAEIGPVHSSSGSKHKSVNSQANKYVLHTQRPQ